MAAARALVLSSVAPLIVQDLPQILFSRRGSVASGRSDRSLVFLSELPLELTDQLFLLLDNKVLGPNIREESIIIIVNIGQVMGL